MPTYRCGSCQQPLQVPDEFAGKKVRCPKCQSVMAIPAKNPQPAPVTPSTPAAPTGNQPHPTNPAQPSGLPQQTDPLQQNPLQPDPLLGQSFDPLAPANQQMMPQTSAHYPQGYSPVPQNKKSKQQNGINPIVLWSSIGGGALVVVIVVLVIVLNSGGNNGGDSNAIAQNDDPDPGHMVEDGSIVRAGSPQNAGKQIESPNVTRNRDLEFIDSGLAKVGKSKSEIESLFKDAENGKAEAQNAIGVLLAEGVALKKDGAGAVAWFQKAADQGLAAAQTRLGDIYNASMRIPEIKRNVKKAVRWYELAAEQGDATAQLKLGGIYAMGSGIDVEQDEERAEMWWRNSALQGNLFAQKNLGFHHRSKFGATDADTLESFVWYSVAANSGDDYAKTDVELGEAGLTPEQLIRANQRIKAIEAVIAGTKDPSTLSAFDSSGNSTRPRMSSAELQSKTESLTSLTLEQAKEFVEQARDRIVLSGLTSLDDEVAAELAKFDGKIWLQGLTELPDTPGFLGLLRKQASERRPGGLNFSAAKSISLEAAKVLAEHPGQSMYFRSLESLPNTPTYLKLLEIALRSDRMFSTDKIKTMSPEAAKLLIKNYVSLDFPKLENINVDLAKVLIKDGGLLQLYEKDYSKEVLEELVKHRGRYLVLHGLTKLEDWQAELLSRYKGALTLTNVTQISLPQAKQLAKIQGGLGLDGVTELSTAAIAELSKIKAGFTLNGIKSLSVEQARALAKLNIPLSMNSIEELSESVAAELGQHSGPLMLAGLTRLSPEVTRNLVRSARPIWFESLTVIPDDVAEALGQHKSVLNLSNVTELSDVAAGHLSNVSGKLTIADLKRLDNNPGHLKLARKLANTETLYLSKLESLEAEIAKVFAESSAKELSFYGLKSISDGAAEQLSRFRGKLSLAGLRTMSDAAAASLAKHKGRLDLSGLDRLSRNAAESVRKHPNAEIFIIGF